MRLCYRVLVLLAPAALAACASSHGRRPAGSGQDATLEVKSDHMSPVDLYAVRAGGSARRIGGVYTGRVERFVLGSDITGAGGTVRIIAVPVTGNGRASTGDLVVRPGDVVRFNVAMDLRASSVFVR